MANEQDEDEERQLRELNPLIHQLVPKHEVLSEEEAEEVLRRYNVERSQLPKIKFKDPALEALRDIEGISIKECDIIKITRRSPTAGIHVVYRMVVMKK